MRIRQIVSVSIIVLLLAYATTKLGRLRSWFVSNKVVYLMNQDRYDEAEALLAAEPANARQSSELKKARGKLYVQRGDYHRALDELENISGDEEAELLKAVSLFQLDDEDAAAEVIFRSRGIDGKGAIPKEVRDLAACAFTTGTCTVPRDFGSRESIELMFYESVAGRALLNGGQFTAASQRLARALDLDDRNSRTPMLACISAAADGHFSLAAYHVDSSADPAAFCRKTAGEAAALRDKVSTATLSPRSATAGRIQQQRLGLAIAWLKQQPTTNTETSDTADLRTSEIETLSDEPELLWMTQWMKADLLTAQGKEAEAYSVYDGMLKRLPNYRALVRMTDLAGWNEESFAAATETFLSSISTAHRAGGAAFQSRNAQLRGNVLCFYQASSAENDFHCAGGSYEVGITARADRAFGLSPLARISIDGRRIGELYIAREGWDFYSLPVALESGSHRLKIEYLNNSVRLLSQEEDRNMYLREVIVAHSGADQI